MRIRGNEVEATCLSEVSVSVGYFVVSVNYKWNNLNTINT